MTSNRQEIDDLKAEVQQTKQELASARQSEDAEQVVFHRQHLLQLESQLSSLREQQTILLRMSQECLAIPSVTSAEATKDRQVAQQPVLDATEQAADQVVGPLQSHGFAWLKVSKAETRSFQQLQQYAKQPDSCFDQAGKLLGDKMLMRHNVGKPSSKLPSAMFITAADKVCNLMDCHARQVLEAISRSHYLGLASSSLNCILDSAGSTSGQAAASNLDIALYFKQSQSTDQVDAYDPYIAHYRHGHIDRGLLTLIWSDSTSGLQVASPRGGDLVDVKIPEGYILVLTGYTLEHVTCGTFRAARHHVVLSGQATDRLSFAYKLRSPENLVLNQHHKLSASSKDSGCLGKMTAGELTRRFDLSHMSINDALTDLVEEELSPEWQHSVKERHTTKHSVNDDWIWHRLISTMGWQRSDQTIHFKSFHRQPFSMRVHLTWKAVGVESLLQIVHDFPPPGSLRLFLKPEVGPARQLDPSATLSESRVTDGCTIHYFVKLRGDLVLGTLLAPTGHQQHMSLRQACDSSCKCCKYTALQHLDWPATCCITANVKQCV